MPADKFEGIVEETDQLLERRLRKVRELVDARSSDININPFLMLALAPAYNIFSPFEAAEYIQNSKLHHGDATAFGKFIEDKILPPFGVTRPPEKDKAPDLYSSIDIEATVEGARYFLSLKSGPWTMNQSHANEMISAFPAIHDQTGRDIVIGIVYGVRERLNNKPALVEKSTGPYTHTLVGHEFWEFITGVRDAHKEIFKAIRTAQARFAERHGGKTYFEQLIEARLALAASFRDAFDLEGEDAEMWEKIFEGSF
ncbi:MAG TPA: PmeII family type II restriction endonuclease [Solirubrobacterales bacterium]|nr:PmeII family type II restriction endonuclease [Solirubrobacterales bacterium]